MTAPRLYAYPAQLADFPDGYHLEVSNPADTMRYRCGVVRDSLAWEHPFPEPGVHLHPARCRMPHNEQRGCANLARGLAPDRSPPINRVLDRP